MNISGTVKLALKAAAVFQLLSRSARSGGENRLVLHTAKGAFTFNIEIADDGKERARGLMFPRYARPPTLNRCSTGFESRRPRSG